MDVDKLIALVRQYPVLYDVNHHDYLRLQLKEEIWKKIGAEFNLTGGKIKNEWRKLRERHREALRRRNIKNGYTPNPSRPWFYQHQMEFLVQHMKHKPGSKTKVEQLLKRDTDDEEDDIHIDDATGGDANSSSESFAKNDLTTSDYMTDTCVKNSIVTRSEVPLTFANYRNCDDLKQQYDSGGLSTQKSDSLYQFFIAMYSITKELPHVYQRRIRNKLYEVVSQAEEQYEFDRCMSPPTLANLKESPPTFSNLKESPQTTSLPSITNLKESPQHYPEFLKIGQANNVSDDSAMSPTSYHSVD